MQLDALVTEALPLSRWAEAFERTAAADGLKLVIDPRLDPRLEDESPRHDAGAA